MPEESAGHSTTKDRAGRLTIDEFIARFERGLARVDTLPIAAARRFYDRLCRSFAPPVPPAMHICDTLRAAVPVRCFVPARAHAGRIVYIHGGGFSLGSVTSHHGVVADLARRLARPVTSVDYRLMPEATYEQALADCLAVIEAESPVALVGDSAGGRLIIDAAWRSEQPCWLGLVYPYLGASTLESLGADAPLLARSDITALETMLADDAPLAAEGPPPARGIEMLAVEHDPLTRPIESAARRWAAAGASVGYRCAPGMVHAALHAHHRLPAMHDAWHDFCGALRDRLESNPLQ